MKKILLAVLAVTLFMGAKGCSDCEKKTAIAAGICQAQPGTLACLDAQAAADKACAPDPEPTPTPTPIPTPTPTPIPTPTPPTTCEPSCKATEKCVERGSVQKLYECVTIPGIPVEAPLIDDGDLTHVGTAQPSQMWAETDAAIRRWRELHPEKWRGDGACLISVSGIDEAFLGISTELLRFGTVAGQSISSSGQRSDCIFVNRTGTQFYEEAHIFEYGRACVATSPKAMKELYRRGSAPPVEPPPVTTTCPHAPCPLKVWTVETLPPGWGEDMIGKSAWEWVARSHTMGNADSTPIVIRQEPFCASIGMSPMADGSLRASCPVRPDGHSQREAVENWLLDGGPVRDSRSGQNCTPNNNDNPYAFLFGTGNCRVCNTTKTTCSGWL